MFIKIDKSSIKIMGTFEDSIVFEVKYRVCDVKIGWEHWSALKCNGKDVVANVSCRLCGRSIEDCTRDFVYCSVVALERILKGRKYGAPNSIYASTFKIWQTVTESYLENFESEYEIEFYCGPFVHDYK